MVRLLLQRGATPNAQNYNGRTALWEAANADLSESGSYDVDKGPLPPTPAQRLAWRTAYIRIIHALMAHGANPNLITGHTTPLIVAVQRGREAQVEALLRGGADPNLRDRFGKTPLQWAAYIGFPRIVKRLRAHRAWIAPPGLRGPTGRDLDERLVAAISRHDVAQVRELLARGADANAHVNLWNKHSPYGSTVRDESEQVGFQTPLLTATNSPLITR